VKSYCKLTFFSDKNAIRSENRHLLLLAGRMSGSVTHVHTGLPLFIAASLINTLSTIKIKTVSLLCL